MKKIIKLLTFSLLLAALSSSLHAQIAQWTGVTDGNWNTGSNWSSGAAPSQDGIFSSAGLNQALNLSAATSIRTMYLYGGNYSVSPTASETLSFTSAGGLTQLGSGTFIINNNMVASGLTLNGTGTGAITLNGTLNNGLSNWDKFNESNVNLTNAYTTTNATANALRIRSGALNLSGAGTITQGAVAQITIGFAATYQAGVFHSNASAALVLDNTGTNNTNRVTDTNQINFNTRGLLDFRGNASAASSETFGTLNASGPGTRIRVSNGGGQSSQLTFASLVTPNGAITLDTNGNPTLMQFLVPTGSTLGATGASGSRIIFTAAPTLTNGVLRYGVIKDESSGGGANFATYNTTVDNGVALGVQALAAYTTTDINASTATANVDMTGNVTLTGNRSANAIRINTSGAGQSLTMDANTLTLGNANGFIFNGGNDYAINNTGGTGVTVGGAGYLYINSNTLTINAPVVKNSEMTKAGDGALVINGGFNNVSARHLGVDDGAAVDDMTINGVISGVNLVKAGLGTLVLGGSGSNSTFSAGVIINAGTVILDKSTGTLQNNALGSGVISLQGGTLAARNTAVTLANTLNLGPIGSGQSGNQFTGNQAITFTGLVQSNTNSSQVLTIVNNATADVTFSGTVQGFNANNVNPQTSTLEFSGSGTTNVSGVIRNTDPTFANAADLLSNVVKNGAGLLTLSGANTYTGFTHVFGGYLRLDSAGALGGASLLIAQGNNAGGLNAVVELGTGNTSFTRAVGTGAGQVRLGGTSGNGINNAGFASVNGTSTVNLGGAAAAVTWGTGSFFDAGGALQLGSPNVAGTVDFQNGINLNGNRTITALNGSAAIDGIVSGVIANGAPALRTLTKDGAGGLSLTAANTYTGGTIVSAGTLLVNNLTGSGTGAGTVTVNTGGTLGGSGFLTGPVVVNTGATLSPGNSPGNLTVANDVTFNTGSNFTLELNGNTAALYDRVTMTGTGSDLSLNGTNNLNIFLGYSVAVNDIFFVGVGSSTAISGVFEQLNGVNTTLTQGSTFNFGVNTFEISYTGNLGTTAFAGAGNDLVLRVAAIPEPSTYALLASGLVALAFLRRRKKSV